MSILGSLRLPSNWPLSRLDGLFTRSFEADAPDLEPLSVFTDDGVVPRSSRDHSYKALGADLAKNLRVRPGDLVFNKLRTWQGAIGVSSFDGIVSPAYFVLRGSEHVEPRFFHYMLRSSPWVQELKRVSKYMPPNQNDIAWDDLKAIRVAVPPLHAQRAIVAFLDTETARIDSLIEKKQRMIELLQARWVTTRNDVILCGVDPISGRGSLPEAWDCPQLGVIVELQRGHDLPFEARREGRIPIVSSGGVTGYHDRPACAGPAVVTGRYGTVGEVYFIDEPCWPLNTTLYVKDFRGNNARWVAFALESIPLEAESEKSAVGGINRNVIGKLRVPRPPLSEQIRIAERLLREQRLHDSACENVARQIELLRERRQALITAAVTGELEVPGVAA